MRRREFITGFVGGAVTWSMAVHAQQQSRKLRTIGFFGTATSLAWNTWVSAFLKRLSELGWLEGNTIAIEYRWAEGRPVLILATLVIGARLLWMRF